MRDSHPDGVHAPPAQTQGAATTLATVSRRGRRLCRTPAGPSPGRASLHGEPRQPARSWTAPSPHPPGASARGLHEPGPVRAPSNRPGGPSPLLPARSATGHRPTGLAPKSAALAARGTGADATRAGLSTFLHGKAGIVAALIGVLCVGGAGTLLGAWMLHGPLHTPATLPLVSSGRFTITGDAGQSLGPGVAESLDLRIQNPATSPITITGITVRVEPDTTSVTTGAPNPGCPGTVNLEVVHQFTGSVTVPAGASETLTAAGAQATQLPRIRMPDLPTDQDACKGTVFHLAYSGSAT